MSQNSRSGDNGRQVVESARRSLLSDEDLFLFNEGTHHRLYEKLGAHPAVHDGAAGTYFAVWAPNAEEVAVETYAPSHQRLALEPRARSGIWEGFLPGVGPGTLYKYRLRSRNAGYRVAKADPFAFHCETPPATASVVWNLDYSWADHEWMAHRRRANALDAPLSIYELHLGSWRRPHEANQFLSYRQLAQPLAEYVRRLGFTHVEFLPVMEHPFYGSWGYQTTGYFAPTARYGTPQDFMYLVDHLHQQGIGVILDWVPSHFPNDEHGLAYFDGTHLYEHADPRLGVHPDWNSLIFNYGRNEVRGFLLSSAMFWLEKYHVDALRVDAVASMLYLDYSRQDGEWIPNEFGGRENLHAISFLRHLNQDLYQRFPDVQTIAEESTAWPMVSRPVYVGGLGFGMKWDMGWMHDTLHYIAHDPIHRKYHHNALTFRQLYAGSENFVLPLSHDEVVHGKGSLWNKIPGDDWQKAATLRLLFGYQWAQNGKKLLFMGGEFGQRSEWNHDAALDWWLLDDPTHAGIERWVADLNHFYRSHPALFARDFEPEGFEWIECCDAEQSVIAFLRRGPANETVLVACNFTPVPRHSYRLGVPRDGFWREALNSDARDYGGSGQGNLGGVDAIPIPCFGRPWSITLNLPPLAILFLVPDGA
jgi:1,4-alpha-glucan branching enzyme